MTLLIILLLFSRVRVDEFHFSSSIFSDLFTFHTLIAINPSKKLHHQSSFILTCGVYTTLNMKQNCTWSHPQNPKRFRWDIATLFSTSTSNWPIWFVHWVLSLPNNASFRQKQRRTMQWNTESQCSFLRWLLSSAWPVSQDADLSPLLVYE